MAAHFQSFVHSLILLQSCLFSDNAYYFGNDAEFLSNQFGSSNNEKSDLATALTLMRIL